MPRSADVLSSIVEHKRHEVAAAKSSVTPAELNDHIASQSSPRGFEKRLRQHLAGDRPGIIAECKKASPSKGVIRTDYNMTEIVSSYQDAGASCLSVLTDHHFFQGSAEHLRIAKRAGCLPVLRKDFIIDRYQIHESRAMGADCILLIVAVLELTELRDFANEAAELGLDVLIEVHSEREIEMALQVDQGMVGINNRNLHTFETALETSIRLCGLVPDARLVISESGIHSQQDVQALNAAGIQAFLIGESFMRASNPGWALTQIFGHQQLTGEPGVVS